VAILQRLTGKREAIDLNLEVHSPAQYAGRRFMTLDPVCEIGINSAGEFYSREASSGMPVIKIKINRIAWLASQYGGEFKKVLAQRDTRTAHRLIRQYGCEILPDRHIALTFKNPQEDEDNRIGHLTESVLTDLNA